MIPVIIIVSILIFFIVRLIPGDPVTIRLGIKATPQMIETLHKEIGLDKPIFVQYVLFIKNILNGNLGYSIRYCAPIYDLLKQKIMVTLFLISVSLTFSVIISFPLGYFAAIKENKIQDQIIRNGALIALATPQFWTGLVLMIIFAVSMKIFPVGGWGESWPQRLRAIILPAFTQSLWTGALLTRNLRNSIIDILKMDYIDFAKSTGLSTRVIKKRYIIRNAMIPYITLGGLELSYMLGGSIIVERVFALPGIGALMVESIYGRDYSVIQGVVLLIALLVIIINLFTDLMYAYLDPRVKLE